MERPIRKRLLAIDGGGVRGIVPLTLLANLEDDIGSPVREVFDFLAGTSSGAVTVAGLAAGVPARRLLDVYEHRAAELFRRMPIVSTAARVVTGSMYDITLLHRVIREELPVASSEWTMNDAPVDLLVTAKRVSDGMPWYFVRDNAVNSRRAGGYRLADAVTASAAAPTYFEPWSIAGIGELVDGAIGVTGNPVYQACVEAFHYTSTYEPPATLVVSLGTGQYPARQRPSWLWPWMEWLLMEMLRSPAEQQTQLVRRHYPDTPLHRFDVDLGHPMPLDDVSVIGELRAIGERLAATVNWAQVLEAGASP